VVVVVLCAAVAGLLVRDHLAHDGGKAIAWRDVTAQLPGATFDRAVARRFETRAELQQYLARAMPGRAPHTPALLHAHEELLLVAPGPRSSTGYGVAIEAVLDQDDRILVRVREQTPTLGTPVAARVTYPYRLLVLPSSRKPVLVDWQGRP
jgi:hypothetical protein